MLRRFLRTSIISLSKAGWAQNLVSHWGFAWRIASRFVTGQRLEDALAAIELLNHRGINASLDHLGEYTSSAAEARESTAEVIHELDGIEAAGARSNVSIKLTQMGLLIDEDLCCDHLRAILQRARDLHTFIRIDMEESAVTEQTLRLWEWARQQGFDNVGVVMQSYLYRTAEDVARVLRAGGRIRLVKGAYDEPAQVAFPKKADVDANYDRLATQILEGALQAGAPLVSQDGRIPPIAAFGTHDIARIQHVQAEAKRLGLPKGAYEFQMIYGIRRDLQQQLIEQGYPLRVYVPYGTHWYPYFMRRLAERPANLWFFASNFFKK